MWAYLLFFFIAFGSKVVLALATIYFLLPAERSCSQCNGETVAIVPRLWGWLLARAMLGRVERRWCPRCGWEGTTRRERRRTARPMHTSVSRRVPE